MEYVYTKIGHMEFFAPDFGLSDSADNREERLNIVEVGHSLPYPGKRVVRRTDCHHLHFITSGGGFIDGTEIPSGRGFYVEAGSIYSEEVGCGGLEQYWINFTGSDCAALLGRLGIDRDARIFDFSSESGRIRAAFDEVFGRGERVQNEFSLLGLLFRTISYINRGGPRSLPAPEYYACAAEDYIRLHFSEPLGTGRIAAELGLSAKYLSRLYSSVRKKTLIGFITATRMEAARHLLRYTNDSIGAIAAAVGFSDQLYFSKVFRRFYGYPPSDVKRPDITV